MTRIELEVRGMHCNSCAMLINEELEDEGARDITITIDKETQTGKITCTTEKSRDELTTLIEELGDYTITKTKEVQG